MNDLSLQQQSIVDSNDKVVMVIAGPGSGKTRVLTYKVMRLINEGVNEGSLLLLTFTNKAAKNMIERLENIVGRKLNILGGTFHHVANKFVRQHATMFGYRTNYSIIDEDDSIRLIKDILRSDFQEYAKDLPKPDEIYKMFSYCRNSKVSISDYLKMKLSGYLEYDAILSKLYNRYSERKRRSNMMDFDDLLVYFSHLLDDPGFRESFHKKYTHIFIDEFQDTNRLQFEIVLKMYAQGKMLFVVGDDCQSIYSFRAADVRNMLEFSRSFKDVKFYYLTENYRSAPPIVTFINEIIKNNKYKFDKKLLPVNIKSFDSLPKVLIFDDPKEESEFIAEEIEDMISRGVKPSEIAVLYRSNFHSAFVEMSLAKRNIKYVKLGGLKFFELAHVKDVLAFLKVFNNMTDELAWLRLLRMFDGVGEKTAKKIVEKVCIAKEPLNTFMNLSNPKFLSVKRIFKNIGNVSEVSQVAKRFYDLFYRDYMKKEYGIDFKDRDNDIQQLFSIMASYSTVDELLEDVMLDTNLIDKEELWNRVTLSTVHQAKGLEWDNVFVIGLTQGGFPSKHSLQNDRLLEEERRLFYVACSRARNTLVITAPLSGGWAHSEGVQISQFICELPKETYRIEEFNSEEDYTEDFVSADKLL